MTKKALESVENREQFINDLSEWLSVESNSESSISSKSA